MLESTDGDFVIGRIKKLLDGAVDVIDGEIMVMLRVNKTDGGKQEELLGWQRL